MHCPAWVDPNDLQNLVDPKKHFISIFATKESRAVRHIRFEEIKYNKTLGIAHYITQIERALACSISAPLISEKEKTIY